MQQTLINNAFRTASGSAVVEVTHVAHGFIGGETITISDAAAVGGIAIGNLNNAEDILAIIDENTYTFTANAAATSSEDGGGAAIKVTTGAATLDWQDKNLRIKWPIKKPIISQKDKNGLSLENIKKLI